MLRPLRSVSTVKSLKNMLNALFSSFSMLKDNIIVMLFYYIVFSIAGQQIFSGNLKQNCFNLSLVKVNYYQGIFSTANSNYQDALCYTDTDCKVSPYTVCAKSNYNPEYNLLNFDTFLFSLLQVKHSINNLIQVY